MKLTGMFVVFSGSRHLLLLLGIETADFDLIKGVLGGKQVIPPYLYHLICVKWLSN